MEIDLDRDVRLVGGLRGGGARGGGIRVVGLFALKGGGQLRSVSFGGGPRRRGARGGGWPLGGGDPWDTWVLYQTQMQLV